MVKENNDSRCSLKDTGFLYFSQGKFDLAIEYLTKYLEQGQAHIDVNLVLGRSYRAIEEYEKAIEILTHAYALVPPGDETFYNNKLLNEIEIVQKKTRVESFPTGLWVNLTTRCNLRCIMCNVWKEQWDLPKKTAEEIVAMYPYLEELFWQGGEIFLSEHFPWLLQEALRYPHLKQNINTNGLLITEEWAKKLACRNMSLAFAIDGVTPDTYEGIRKGGCFERLLENIETVNHYKRLFNSTAAPSERMVTIMSFIVMRSNFHELDKVVDFAKQRGFDLLQLNPITSVVDLENIFLHRDEEVLQKIAQQIPALIRYAHETKLELDVRLPVYISQCQNIEEDPCPQESIRDNDSDVNYEITHNPECIEERCPVLQSNDIACELPWKHLFIDRSGAIRSSCHCIKDVAHITKNSLRDAWNSTKMQAYRQRIISGDFKESCFRATKQGDLRFELIKIKFENLKTDPSSQEFLQAFKEVQEYIALNGRVPEAYSLLARMYELQKDYPHAANAYRRLLAITPESQEALYEMALMYRKTDDTCSAKDALEKVIALNPAHALAHFELARMYREVKEYPRCRQECEKAIALDPGEGKFYFELALVGHEERNYPAALGALQKALDTGWVSPDIFLEKARIYREIKDFKAAAEEIKKVIVLNHDHTEAHFELAKTYHKQGDFDASLKEFDFLVSQHPSEMRFYLEMARVYMEAKDIPSAVQGYTHALTLDPYNGQVHLELGMSYRQQKEFLLALEEFKRALAFGLASVHLHLEIGVVYRELKQWDLAFESFKLASALGLDTVRLHLELAITYRELKRYELAEEELRAARGKEPDHWQVHLEWGRLYLAQKDFLNAAKELRAATEKKQEDIDLLIELARFYLQSEDFKAAYEEFNRAHRLDPQNNVIRQELSNLESDPMKLR
ncbi:MAG: tetratricopeptide repeat protein [Candidatus Omnitrophica bacterium]|nr:tetratricopeptide repeat protein [Candidatus Omnitrophota bacterium]